MSCSAPPVMREAVIGIRGSPYVGGSGRETGARSHHYGSFSSHFSALVGDDALYRGQSDAGAGNPPAGCGCRMRVGLGGIMSAVPALTDFSEFWNGCRRATYRANSPCRTTFARLTQRSPVPFTSVSDSIRTVRWSLYSRQRRREISTTLLASSTVSILTIVRCGM